MFDHLNREPSISRPAAASKKSAQFSTPLLPRGNMSFRMENRAKSDQPDSAQSLGLVHHLSMVAFERQTAVIDNGNPEKLGSLRLPFRREIKVSNMLNELGFSPEKPPLLLGGKGVTHFQKIRSNSPPIKVHNQP